MAATLTIPPLKETGRLPRSGSSTPISPRSRSPSTSTAASPITPRRHESNRPASTSYPGSPTGGFLEGLARADVTSVASNPLTQMGLAYAQQQQNKYKTNLARYLENSNLRYYFNIDTNYVTNKLKIILLPNVNQTWQRRTVRTRDGDAYQPPKYDVNAPDLYIPLMAFVTYVLLVCAVFGIFRGQFSPDKLSRVASIGFTAMTLEVALIKLGFYLLNGVAIPALDLVAYTGYLFVGLAVNHAVRILLVSSTMFYISTLATGIAMAFFMVRTMRLLLPPAYPGNNQSGAMPANIRNYFLLAVAVLQIVLALLLGYS